MGGQNSAGLLQLQLAGFAISVVILAGALIALTLWIVRSNLRDRILLWFGLLALCYSTRELVRNELVDSAFSLSLRFHDFFVSWIDFVILVPGGLFFEEVIGRGWRSCLSWAVWVLAGYAAIAILLGLLTGTPYRLPDPASTILVPLIVVVFLLNRVNHYQRPPFPDLPIVFTGVGILAAFVLDSHWLPERFHAEPVGFIALIGSLGIVAVRRILRKERKLVDVEKELAAARRIQASILPSEAPSVRSLKIATRYSPMTAVAGDFYDFAAISPDCMGILVADVAGHGVPAALIASMVKVAFAAQQAYASHPGSVLAGLNKIFCGQLRGQYVTAGYLVINAQEGTATYAGAGHPPLMVWRAAKGVVERFENNGLFLGFKANESYPEIPIHIFPGDRLLLYTDGLLEASNAAGENFGDSLDQRIDRYRDLNPSALADALFGDLRAWTLGSTLHQQDDDLTLIVVDVEGEPSLAAAPTPFQTVPA